MAHSQTGAVPRLVRPDAARARSQRSPIDLWRDAPQLVPALEGVDDSALETSLNHCVALLTREHRALAAKLRSIPEPRHRSLCALLAWLRAAHEVIDGNWPLEARVLNLDRFRDQTERALDGRPPQHADPMWPAFAALTATYGIDPDWVLTALSEMGEDLQARAVPDAEALRTVCRGLGGCFGLCIGAILGVAPQVHPNEAARLYRKWGIALQLVWQLRNFTRDFDAHPRRVYFPADSFESAGLTPFKIRAWTDPEACAKFVRGWVRVASDQIRAAADVQAATAPDAARALHAITSMAGHVLAVLDRDPSRLVRGARIEPQTSLASRLLGAARRGRP